MPYHKVAELADLPVGTCRYVEAGGERIALCNVEGQIFAVGDECTHADASLSKGTLEGTTLYCPWHNAAFDVRTGDKLSAPAPFEVPRFNVKLVDDEIWVQTRR